MRVNGLPKKAEQEIPGVLTEVLENFNDALIVTDKAFHYVYINKSAEKLLGKKNSEVLGKSFLKLFPESKNNPVAKEARKAMRLGKWSKVEYFGKTNNIWWDVRFYPIYNGVVFHFRDVNFRKVPELNAKFLAQASKVLSSSLDYQTTLNNVAEMALRGIADWCGIDMVDVDGFLVRQLAVAHKDPKKVKWAREFREQHPVDMGSNNPTTEILKTGKSKIFPEITEEMLKASSKNKKEYELAKSLNLRSVMMVPISIRKKPVGVISFITTELERHYNKSDLEMAEELANRSSVAIENAMLYEEAQKAVNLRDDFISIASHELKTPLTSLGVYLQILRQDLEKDDKESGLSHLEKVNSQIGKLNRLIKDLLDVSKIQRGKLEFSEEEFILNDVVKEVIESVKFTSETHQIKFKEQGQIKIRGDRDRIGQIIINLLTNAIKYSPDAKSVDVELKKEGKMVVLSVKDQGIGIDKKDLDKIFERFFQAHDKNDKTYPGLGIGLYVSSEIAQRHGGRINVESKKGKGSTFSLVLPLKK